MEIHRNMCSISFSYVKLYLSQRKKGVSAISKSVRNQYLEFLAETGMTRYEFSKRSGIPESTLWSLGQKEDYDVRESNIRKIARALVFRLQIFLMIMRIPFVLKIGVRFGL